MLHEGVADLAVLGGHVDPRDPLLMPLFFSIDPRTAEGEEDPGIGLLAPRDGHLYIERSGHEELLYPGCRRDIVLEVRPGYLLGSHATLAYHSSNSSSVIGVPTGTKGAMPVGLGRFTLSRLRPIRTRLP